MCDALSVPAFFSFHYGFSKYISVAHTWSEVPADADMMNYCVRSGDVSCDNFRTAGTRRNRRGSQTSRVPEVVPQHGARSSPLVPQAEVPAGEARG